MPDLIAINLKMWCEYICYFLCNVECSFYNKYLKTYNRIYNTTSISIKCVSDIHENICTFINGQNPIRSTIGLNFNQVCWSYFKIV